MVKEYTHKPKEWTSPTGVTTFLFPISELAFRLGRHPNTIRRWEIAGIIPNTPFRNKFGDRLYTTEHIEAIVANAEKAHIRQGSRITSSSFPRNNLKKFKELGEYFFGKGGEDED